MATLDYERVFYYYESEHMYEIRWARKGGHVPKVGAPPLLVNTRMDNVPHAPRRSPCAGTAGTLPAVDPRRERIAFLRRLLVERFGPQVLLDWTESSSSLSRHTEHAPTQSVLNPRALPTELLGLDLALGGGIPRGRLTELAGPPYSGKRTLAGWLVRATQQIGGWAAYLDAAHGADFDRLHRWGVNLYEFLIALPRSLPEVLELARLLLLADALDLVVLDLPPHWATRPELERGLRQLRPLLRGRLTALVVVRDRVSGPGLAAAQVRLRLEPLTQLVLPNPCGSALLPSGLRVRIRVERSHSWPLCEPPVPIELSEREGVRLALERIDLALAAGILVHHPLGLTFTNTVLGRNREAAAARLASDPALWSQLEEELRARWLSLARSLTERLTC